MMFRPLWLVGSVVIASLVTLSGPQAWAEDGGNKPDAPKPGAKDGTKPDAPKGDAAKGEAREVERFLRVTRDKKGTPQSLDTAVVRYVPAKSEGGGDLAVDLVGAVHIGDKPYYKALNKLFQDYDVVLFELVMAEGTKVPDGKPKGDGVFSNMIKSMLDLESQVERIDYTRKNFVHADMSPQQMAQAMKERGDTGLTLTLSVITDMIREANRREQKAKGAPSRKQPEVDLLSSLFSQNGTLDLKRQLADQMAESGDAGAFGATLTTMLITDRNQACVKVLDREIKKGHKKIAIYYGAAHLPDFDKRLTKDFGLKADSTTWLTAWDLTD